VGCILKIRGQTLGGGDFSSYRRANWRADDGKGGLGDNEAFG